MGSRIGALIIKAETFSPRISTTGDHTERMHFCTYTPNLISSL